MQSQKIISQCLGEIFNQMVARLRDHFMRDWYETHGEAPGLSAGDDWTLLLENAIVPILKQDRIEDYILNLCEGKIIFPGGTKAVELILKAIQDFDPEDYFDAESENDSDEHKSNDEVHDEPDELEHEHPQEELAEISSLVLTPSVQLEASSVPVNQRNIPHQPTAYDAYRRSWLAPHR